MATVKRQFLHGMITGEFYDFATHGRYLARRKLTAELSETLDQKSDPFLVTYTEGLQFTIALTFDWHDDAPEHYRSFEAWWNMALNGSDATETFTFLSDHVDVDVINAWSKAYQAALVQWKPPEEQMTGDDQDADPKE